MFEFIGMLAVWLIGLAGFVGIPALLTLKFASGGLEVIFLAAWAAGIGGVLYIAASLLYFALT